MTFTFGSVILSAGFGKRLQCETPKPLLPLLGQRLVDFPIMAASSFVKSAGVKGKIGVVVGHKKEDVEGYLGTKYKGKLNFAVQENMLGTADAMRSYFKGIDWAKDQDYTLILNADTPLLSERELALLYDKLQKESLDAVAATFSLPFPTGYGRIVRGKNGGFHIVEEKEANDEIKKIKEVNSGLYIVKTKFLLEKLEGIKESNKTKEFYLTDIFQDNYKVAPIHFESAEPFLGVNTLVELEEATRLLRIQKNRSLALSGVRFVDIAQTYVDWDVVVGRDTVLYPQVSLHGNTMVGESAEIHQGSILKDSVIANSCVVHAYSHLEKAKLLTGAQVGPFARLRPESVICEDAKIGNFVEIKKATLERGAKVSHLSYVGDASIGENTNIGCGFITCNYDGANKNFTKIGKDCFIGSDTQMIAPIEIGDGSYVASGSTINKSMPAGSFGIARARQEIKEGLAKRFIKKKN